MFEKNNLATFDAFKESKAEKNKNEKHTESVQFME